MSSSYSFSSLISHSSSLEDVVGEKFEAYAGEEEEQGGCSRTAEEVLPETGGLSVLNLLLLVLPARELR